MILLIWIFALVMCGGCVFGFIMFIDALIKGWYLEFSVWFFLWSPTLIAIRQEYLDFKRDKND
jgi:hypothetical protein